MKAFGPDKLRNPPGARTSRSRWLSVSLVALTALCLATSALAGSGGYSRPGSSGVSRTPSTSGYSRGGGSAASGGYRRPSTGGFPSSGSSSGSSVDQSMARRASKDALNRYRNSRSAPQGNGGGWQAPAQSNSPPSYQLPPARNSGRAGSSSWTDVVRSLPVPRRPSAGPGFGDAVLGGVVGGALGRLSNSNSSSNSETDYRDWQVNPGAASVGTQPTSSAQAPTAPGGAVQADAPQAESSGLSWVVWAFVLGAAAFFVFALWRKLARAGAGASGLAPGQGPEAAPPRWFSLSRPLTLDPSPFLLAAQQVAIDPPVSPTGSGMVVLEAVGEAEGPDVLWYRGYCQGGRSFFQIHLNPLGQLDECRYFSQIDEVMPSDEAEWGFWLDPAEGVIGWPEFQTKDGRLYQRLWAAGQARVEPQAIIERLETGSGQSESRQATMLYARPTGLAAPAPETEYLLVAAVEREEGASVLIHVGIDLGLNALQQT